MAKMVLWLALVAFVLFSFEAAARDLAETTETTHQTSESFGDAKYGGYPGGGYGGGYPGYGGGGGYPGYGGGGGYPGGGGGGYPHRGSGGGGYPGGGYGGYCRYGRCCGYYGRCHCCATAAEATAEAAKTAQPQN